MTTLDPNNPAQVAAEIARMMELLESTTATYTYDIEQAGKDEAAYKLAWARAMLNVIDNSSGRMTVAEREARVEVETNSQRVVAEISSARAKATKEALNSIRVALDAARSLGANLRAQT